MPEYGKYFIFLLALIMGAIIFGLHLETRTGGPETEQQHDQKIDMILAREEQCASSFYDAGFRYGDYALAKDQCHFIYMKSLAEHIRANPLTHHAPRTLVFQAPDSTQQIN